MRQQLPKNADVSTLVIVNRCVAAITITVQSPLYRWDTIPNFYTLIGTSLELQFVNYMYFCASSLAPLIRLWLTILGVYKLYLLTYLLTYTNP